MRQERLLSLDALRGVAALAVLIHHAERELHVAFGFAFGYLAVDVFFLISGFVIAAAYEPRMRAGLSLRAFMLLRLHRLYPMMVLGALLGIAVALVCGVPGGAAFGPAAIGGLLMLPLVWTGGLLFPMNAPEWSIFFEIVANVAHRLLLPRLGVGVLLTVIGLSVFGLGVAGWRLHGLANGFSPDTFLGGFPRIGFAYFTGVLLWRTASTWERQVPALPLIVPLVAFAVVVMGEAALGGRVPASAYWALAVLVLFPIGLAVLVRAQVPAGSARVAAVLGDLSYPLYAIHVPLLLAVAPLVRALPPVARTGSAVTLVLGIAGAAWLLDHCYDRPLRRYFQPRRASRDERAPEHIAAP